MRILIVGTEPVGIYYGARLAAGGHAVVFLARDEDAPALRQDGARAEIDGTLIRAEVEVVAEPLHAGFCDVAWVAVKAWVTQGPPTGCGQWCSPRRSCSRCRAASRTSRSSRRRSKSHRSSMR